jgi:voltage-gated potassium channel
MRVIQRRTGQPPPRPLRRARMLTWTRTTLAVLAVVGIYFAIPMTAGELTGATLVIRTLVLVAALPVLTWMVARQVRRALSGERRLGEQIAMLLTLVSVVVAFFASMCFVLANQFDGIRTKVDALYFAVATLCTVGYGDITPVGQGARAMVIVQMLFNLVIVTSAVSIVVTAVSGQANRSTGFPPQAGDDPRQTPARRG